MRALLCLLFGLAVLNLQGQVIDSTSVYSETVDSIKRDSRFRLLPGMPESSRSTSSHAIISIDLLDKALASGGISTLNNLRGNVSNLTMDPFYRPDTILWRYASPLLVIDGIPFNRGISTTYNLNTFEYGSMDLTLSKNASIVYGGTGINGAVVINSKTGEGITKPQFEANSYTTYSWRDLGGSSFTLPGLPVIPAYTIDQWQLSNSAAYSEDFGKVDTRVSLNVNQLSAGTNASSVPNQINLRINTGLDLSRFAARLILTGLSSMHSSANSFNGVTYNTSSQGTTLQGNLSIRYKFLDWLSASAQYSRLNLTHDQTTANSSSNEYQQNNLGNLMVHLASNDERDFTVTGSLAFMHNQYEHSTDVSGMYGGNRFQNGTINGYLINTEFGLLKRAHLGATLRVDHTTHLVNPIDYSAYTVYGSYIFSTLIDPRGSILSFAKIRTSFGYNNNPFNHSFPTQFQNSSSPYPIRLPSSSFEAGLDAAFLKNKLSLTFNYFDNILNNYSSPFTDPATGHEVTFQGPTYDQGIRGIEVIARMTLLEQKNSRIVTQILFGNSQYTLDGGPYGGNHPDWTASWLNQFSWNRFSFSFLIDGSSGGSYYGSSPSGGVAKYSRSFARLREFSIGYEVPVSGWQKAYFSFTGRNLALLYSEPGVDPETAGLINTSGWLKSCSLNIDLIF